jgi:hypothetical protein
MRNVILFLFLFVSLTSFAQDRKHHLIATHLNESYFNEAYARTGKQYPSGSYPVINNNKKVVEMVEKAGGNITFLTDGTELLLNPSSYANTSLKISWGGHFSGIADKYSPDELDKLNLTITGAYFNSCQLNTFFSAITDLADAYASKIVVHIPMPATIMLGSDPVLNWTHEEVISATKDTYLDDNLLNERINNIKTAPTKFVFTYTKAKGLQGGSYSTEEQRTPSLIKDYKVRLFVDGYEYLSETDALTTTSWNDRSDDSPSIKIIFWSSLDKYFKDVLGISPTEPTVQPVK